MNKNLKELQNRIGYCFRNEELLKQALKHPSYSGDLGLRRYESNQRLEFLGDAVAELVVSEYLYAKHPTLEEGELTRMRASLVFEQALNVCARDLCLGEYLYLGKGEENGGGREKPSILSDAFEALIGAIFLDGGYESGKRFIYDFLIEDVDEMSLLLDGKSRIQEYVQRQEGSTLTYKTYDLESPDHMKQFCSDLYINDRLVATGFGHSKKNAEQDAANKALETLQIR